MLALPNASDNPVDLMGVTIPLTLGVRIPSSSVELVFAIIDKNGVFASTCCFSD